MKRIITVCGILISIILTLILFLSQNNYKVSKIGNNINKSADEIKEYILNIQSYTAEVEVTVKSNKNENKYILKQQYIRPNKTKQEVIEPENIRGLTTTYDGINLKIENTQLNISNIYNNYQYISNNDLNLDTFINDYKNDDNAKIEQKEQYIILETNKKDDNKYRTTKTLYIDAKTTNPTKLEIKDITQNVTVYILYNKIEINSQTEEIVAFKSVDLKTDI